MKFQVLDGAESIAGAGVLTVAAPGSAALRGSAPRTRHAHWKDSQAGRNNFGDSWVIRSDRYPPDALRAHGDNSSTTHGERQS